MTKQSRPVFAEPNLLCVQCVINGEWVDYLSVKTVQDLVSGCQLVEHNSEEYRIVRFKMGTTVVYPAR
jgi:hypothetical protein